jgi:phage gp46-like protein
MSDLNLVYVVDEYRSGFGECDLDFDSQNSLYSAVLSSLFSWRRADTDEIEDGTIYGWWADNLNPQRLGSKLWLLQRQKMLPNLTTRAKKYVQEALQWMIEDGVAKQIDVEAVVGSSEDKLFISVIIHQNDGIISRINFDNLWKYV